MKIKPEHAEYIKEQMLAYSNAPLLQPYLKAGLSEKRWRWDWCYRTPGLSKWICDNIYPYANDEHLDTLLRKITGCKDN
jgi:hypothetical protein